MLEVAVASGKGGVGKSTVSATLLIYLSERGYRVAGVDADADAPNLHLLLGVTGWDHEEEYREGYVAEIIQEKCTKCGVCMDVCAFDAIRIVDGRYTINPVICEGCVTCRVACPEKAIKRVSYPTGLLRYAQTGYGFQIFGARLNPGRPNSGKLVTEVKNMARQRVGDAIYIVDSAAGIGCQVVSSLAGANLAVLVAEPTPASFSDLRRVHRLVKHFGLPSALVINKWDINPEYADEIAKYAEEENIDLLGRVPYDDAVPRSMGELRPLVKAYPDAPASKALLQIAKVFEERVLGGWREWMMRHRPKKPEPYRPIIIKPGTAK